MQLEIPITTQYIYLRYKRAPVKPQQHKSQQDWGHLLAKTSQNAGFGVSKFPAQMMITDVTANG